MTALRGALVLIVLCGVQAALGRLWAEAGRYVDLLAVPVVWYAAACSQRAGMFAGVASGLLQDAWLDAGVLGLTGFKHTLLGWAVGGVAATFDLASFGTRVLAGVLFALADAALDLGMRSLLDLSLAPPSVLEVTVRTLTTGLLVAWGFRLADRGTGRRARRWTA